MVTYIHQLDIQRQTQRQADRETDRMKEKKEQHQHVSVTHRIAEGDIIMLNNLLFQTTVKTEYSQMFYLLLSSTKNLRNCQTKQLPCTDIYVSYISW